MKRLSGSIITIIVQWLFASKQGQLGGGDPGLFDFWNRLYYDVRQLPAVLPDNRHDPFFGYEEFFLGKYLQGIVKTQTLYFRPVIIPAEQLFVP